MPAPLPLNGAFFIQASAHPCHALSKHIGSSNWVCSDWAGEDGKHTHSFVPARSCRISLPALSGQSMIVARLAIPGGAALMALAIFCASVILAFPADPDWCWAATPTTLTTMTTGNMLHLRNMDTSRCVYGPESGVSPNGT